MKRDTNRKLTNFKLPPDLLRTLDKESKKQCRTKTAIVEMALRNLLYKKA